MTKFVMMAMVLLWNVSLHSEAGTDRLRNLWFAGSPAFSHGSPYAQSSTNPSFRYPERDRFSLKLSIRAGTLYSPKMGDFKSEELLWENYETGEIRGTANFILDMGLGMGINSDTVPTNLMVGFGYLCNGSFGAPFYHATAMPIVPMGDRVALGFHAGYLRFTDATWHNVNAPMLIRWKATSSDIDLEGGDGYRCGMDLIVGSTTTYFMTSISYLGFAFDVTDARTDSTKMWKANKDELDISGWMIQMGFYFRF